MHDNKLDSPSYEKVPVSYKTLEPENIENHSNRVYIKNFVMYKVVALKEGVMVLEALKTAQDFFWFVLMCGPRDVRMPYML